MSFKSHIIQISLDEDVFDENAAQDSRARQISYAQYLKNTNKTIHLTNIILTQNRSLKREELENVTFIPCHYIRLRHIISLALFLRRFHSKERVLLITTQDIHGIFWGAVIFSWMEKVPVIGQIHYDLSSSCAREELFVRLYGRLYEKIALRLLNAFDGLRVVNSAIKKYLESIGYKNSVCISPVPVTTYSVNKNLINHGWKLPGALRVLYVGRFVEVKNLDCWIETARIAMQENENIEFAMIGGGDEKARMEEYSQKYGLRDRLQFTGSLTPEQLSNWYASADVLLLTSNHEGFGRVVIEAMDYKVVPVCTNVSGPKDIIKHGDNGFLSEANPELLSKYLIYLEKNRDKLKAMGRLAKDTVEDEYSSKKLQKNWIDFLLSYVNDQLVTKE